MVEVHRLSKRRPKNAKLIVEDDVATWARAALFETRAASSNEDVTGRARMEPRRRGSARCAEAGWQGRCTTANGSDSAVISAHFAALIARCPRLAAPRRKCLRASAAPAADQRGRSERNAQTGHKSRCQTGRPEYPRLGGRGKVQAQNSRVAEQLQSSCSERP